MQKILFVALFLFTFNGMAQQNLVIEGTTTDAVSGNPIPFVSIVLKNSARGMMSNDAGVFRMHVTEEMQNDSLLFSCIGYELAKIPVSALIGKNESIQLIPKSFELQEVVVFPLLPEEYIRRAVEKIPMNYASEPSISTGYYTELMSENKQFLKYEEAVTETWVPAIGDTAKPHTSVLHARMAKDLVELQFMREHLEKKAEKQARKQARKNKKTGEESPAEEADQEIVSANFGGPAQVLASDPARNHDAFMKPENFKKFNYRFEPQVALGDKTLMVIAFDQRRQIEQTKTNGKIYIDMESDAIVAIEYVGTFNIPMALKPILFAMGYGISDPTFQSMVHYREQNGRWHVNHVQRDIQIALTKKYMWKKNEHADFDIKQTYVVQQLKTQSVEPIEESLRMNGDETMTKQARFKDESFWDTFSTARPQKLETYLDARPLEN